MPAQVLRREYLVRLPCKDPSRPEKGDVRAISCRKVEVVRHKDHRKSILPVQSHKKMEKLQFRRQVDPLGGLIEEEEARLSHEGSGHQDALALASSEGPVIFLVHPLESYPLIASMTAAGSFLSS